jgi:hypothetical protein
MNKSININNEQNEPSSSLINKETVLERAKEIAKEGINYDKYSMMIIAHLITTSFFAAIYYYLMLDFDTHWFAPAGYTKKYWLDHKMLMAFYISINFETTVAYVDIKCKNIISRTAIVAQICATFLITFYVLLSY